MCAGKSDFSILPMLDSLLQCWYKWEKNNFFILATSLNLDLAAFLFIMPTKSMYIGKSDFLNHSKLGVGNTRSANHLFIRKSVKSVYTAENNFFTVESFCSARDSWLSWSFLVVPLAIGSSKPIILLITESVEVEISVH